MIPRLHLNSLRRLVLVVAACLVFSACDSIGENGSAGQAARTVFVANQGNFGDGNGSVTAYDVETGVAEETAISGLGSIVQSIHVNGDRLYVMANTGGRIDVFDAASLEQVAQIGDVVSPRYMLVDGSTAYVTSLYGAAGTFMGGLVTVVDLDGGEKLAEIPVGDNPEGMALVGRRLYVANSGFGSGTTVSVVDVGSRTEVDVIDVGCDGPRFVEADAENDVFIFCTGKTLYDENFNPVGETNGAVVVLDGVTGSVTSTIAVEGRIGTAGPGQDAYYVPEDDAIFAVRDSEALLVFDTVTNALDREIGPFTGQPIGAVAYDAPSQRFYLGRSNGYTQAGEVSIHDQSGVEVGRFTAGIAPSFIVLAEAADVP